MSLISSQAAGFSFALRETMQFAGTHLVTSLLAFNVLAAPDKQVAAVDIGFMVRERKIPASLATETQIDPERQKATLFRRASGNARVTVFEGGHDSESSAGVLWLSRQRKGQPADFSLGADPGQAGAATEVSK